MRIHQKAIALLLLFMLSGVQVMTQDLSEEQKKVLEANQETHEFQAETGRLMDILINSLYTQKEIFLRELISNAADAIDKIRFLAVKNPEVLGETTDMSIRIEVDQEEKTVSITDTGIGMTRNDLISNLGTIAKSGTTQFIEAIKGGNLNLIGQFGVGFYSCFLAGQRVTVTSKNVDDDQYIWESQAAHQYIISKDPRGNTLGRGTKVTIHLKQDAVEFAEENTIRDLIKKYSEFINFPIYLKQTREISREVADEEPQQEQQTEQQDNNDEIKVKDDEDDNQDTKKQKTHTVKEKVSEWVQINENKAIWLRPKEDISDEDYKNFYKALSKSSSDDPFDWVHFKAEGEVEFTALMYVPKRAPSDLFDNYYGKQTSNLKLYVRRVLISEEFEDLLPRYLSFVKGVIDSDELPLNVNRETLQQLKMLKVISRKVVKKLLELFKKAASNDEDDDEDGEEEEEGEDQNLAEISLEEQNKLKQEKRQKKIDAYNEFWKEYGKNIKLGVIEDSQNRQKLAQLTRWHSSRNATDLTSLDDYISRAKPGQDSIYYIAGENKEQLLVSPIIEGLLKKGYEVLLLEDPVDEFTFQHLNEYEKKKLVHVGKGDFKAPEDNDESRKKLKALKKVFQPLTDWWKKLLSESVDTVQISQRLVDDPLLVISSESGYSANMERISKAQAYSNKGNAQQFGKKIVEINPNHQAIQELLNRVKDDPDQETEEMAKVLYEAAMINSGYSVPNPEKFASRFYKLFNSALGIERDAPIKEYEVELEAEPEPEVEQNNNDDGTNWEQVNTDDAKWESSQENRDDL